MSFLLAVLALFLGLFAVGVGADPAADALVELTELSRRAEQTTEQIHSAQIVVDERVAAQRAAEQQEVADRAVADAASVELDRYQGAVDELAAATYVGGRTDSLAAVLTAASPQQLIDQLAIQRTVTSQMRDTMAAFQSANARAREAVERSAQSALRAREAVERAAAARSDLEAKQARVREQIAEVQARYDALTPDQRAVLADPGPPPPPSPSVSDPSIVAMPGPAGGVSGGGGEVVVQAALTRVGSPYSWGATGPDAFDCSGLIKWAFLQTGKSLPRSSQALAQGGQPVSVADVQPGDIVTFYDDVSHAGIYIGDGMMVHASTYGTPVKVAPISSAPIHNVRRY